MKYVLYKYKENTQGDPSLVYLCGIRNKEPQFSRYCADAKRYSLPHALYLSFFYRLTWISEKYIPQKK
ncbi:MAG: hypothetical protein ACTHMM_18445 [Agriterribacter sp.]